MPRATKRVDTDGLPFAIYCRLSRKKPARKRGGRVVPDTETVDYQARTLRDFAAEQAYPIAEHLIFKDNARSAWKQKGATRPAWIAMMDAAKRGEIAGILIYRVDRFTRSQRDGMDLLDVAENFGLFIDGVKSGKINLNTAAGRKQFRDMVSAAEYESDVISERTREYLDEIMREGKPMGPARCFGFDSGGENDDQRPAEVGILRDLAARRLAGESYERLADELNARGITTVLGFKWTGPNLGKMLCRHRYGGRVEHNGEIVGRMPGEPVFDEDTYKALQEMKLLGRRGRRPTGRFPLTGEVCCSDCKRIGGGPLPMNGKSRLLADGTKVRDYRCPVQLGGCGRSIMAGPLEEMVSDHMVKLLADPAHAAEVVAQDAYLNEARSAKLADLDDVGEKFKVLTAKYTAGELGRGAAAKAAFEHGLATLGEQAAKLEGVLGVGGELSTDQAMKKYDAGLDWADMTDEQKRRTIRHHGVKIMVGPQPKGVRWFTRDRVELS